MPEFAWEAIQQLEKVRGFEIEVIMPVPHRHFRRLQSRLRQAKGARAWPQDLDLALNELTPRPTLIPYLPVPSRSIESAVTAISLSLIARTKSRRPKLLHGSFLDEGGYAAAQVASVIGCPSLAVAHGSDVKAARKEGARGARSRTCLRKANEVVSVSEYLAQEIGFLGRQAHVFPFTADDECFELAAKPQTEPCKFLFVGRLEPAKGIDLLLEAFAQLENADAKLTLVGPQVPEYDLDKHIKQLGIEAQTEYLGELTRNQLQTVYSDASCLVLPSRTEGLGCVLVESLLVGRPVIGTRIGGIPEIVSHDVGHLIDEPKVGSLLQAMQEMIVDLKHDRFVPEKLRTRILPKTWRHTAPKLEALSRQLLKCESSS